MSIKTTTDTFSQAFEKAKKDGLTETEKQKLKDFFLKLPKDKQKEVLEKYKNIKEQPEKSFIEGLKTSLGDLKKDVESSKSIDGFSSLEKKFEKNESMKEILDLFGNYIDFKLDKSFSNSEKEIIKLTLFGEIEKKMNFSGAAELVLNKIISPLKNLLNKFNNKKTGEIKTEDLNKISDEFNTFGEKFGFDGISTFIDTKLEKIKKAKKKNKKIEKIDDILNITDPNQIGKINKESILKNTEKLAKTLEKGKGVGDEIKKGLEKMPFGDKIIGWLKDFAKSSPIIGFILSLFFGKDFLSEGGKSTKESIKKLEKFSEEKDFPLKGIIKTEQLKDLDSKKLEKFYKYLDSKNIDYNTETFWQELLTGKSKDKKIIELNKLLKNKDGKILGKDDGIKEFLGKLNGLGEVKNKQKIEKNNSEIANMEKELDLLETAPVAKTTPVAKTAPVAETTDTKNSRITELKEKLNLKKFETSVLNFNKLGDFIEYKGKKLKLDIVDNKIILGKDTYSLSVSAEKLGGQDIFKKIEFDGKNIIIKTTMGGDCFTGLCEGKEVIGKDELIGTIKKLILNKKFIKKIKDEETGKIKATFTIKKA